ncbi:MAG: endonuclease/exonuclease/phosphatase family protein [Phenylobacterium sp.]|jgi:endonuclease/exonuclease/phosphatase family metal-dependent hydrolase|nr:endonuclease/exonuclease/phosphatase family protein [Phenylobacterium sp.]
MRIVTLNTWKNEGQYERRLALMAEGLGELEPDVVCLQECFQADGFDTARHLADALGLDAALAPARHKLRAHQGRRIESASGLAILRRNGALASGRLALPSDPADGERIGQWADVAPGLRVLNLHLTHLRGPQASSLRAAQLAKALAAARRPGAGLIVAGDLNAPADAPDLAQIAAALDLAAAPTLQGERDGHPAYPGAIDHLALVDSGGWAIRRRFRALDRPDAEGWHPSDHAAVVADLERR